jgi:hypothetical protein
MRPPRYQFPEEVRTATRSTASRMIASGDVAQSPEELAAWIDASPDVEATLREGGYGTEFNAEDLYPLLQAMLAHQGVREPAAAAPERKPQLLWIGGAILLLLLIVLVVFLTGGARVGN